MISKYLLDVLDKLLQFLGLLYFVYGFFTNYAWGCIKLDTHSNNTDILNFWSPIAGVTAFLNFGHVLLIILFLYQNWKYMSAISKHYVNVLFYILSVPLFLASVAYMITLIVRDAMIMSNIGVYTLLMHIGQLGFFCATMSMIVILNIKKLTIRDPFQNILMRFVMLITIIEIVHYFLFHIISQQINNFINVASNYSIYSHFYDKSFLNKMTNPFGFNNIQVYMEPVVILFCCVCVPYLIILKDLIEKNSQRDELSEDLTLLIDTDFDNEEINEDIYNEDISNLYSLHSLKLPPVSLVIGILLTAVSLLIVVIANSLISAKLFIPGHTVSLSFSIFLYLLSFMLLFIQLHEMKRWSKLITNNNIVDKILLWFGVSGHLILAIAQIEYYIIENNTDLCILGIIQNFLLIVQTMVQYSVITLALDRKWIRPSIKTWQEYICPSIGMLSINLGLVLVTIFNTTQHDSFSVKNDKPIFSNLFILGFEAFGETLSILQRFHAILIFGKIILITNRT